MDLLFQKGLGQTEMAFCGDEEDVASVCLSALRRLLRRYKVPVGDIGFLEVSRMLGY